MPSTSGAIAVGSTAIPAAIGPLRCRDSHVVSAHNRISALPCENGHKVDDSDSQLSADADRRKAYAEDRKSRLQRKRLIWFLVSFALWVLSVVPLARESTHGREGAGAVAVYLAVGAITLAVAAAIRGIYVLLTKRNLWWSPWVFVLAAVVAISIYLVQSSGPGGLISAPRPEPTEERTGGSR